MIDDTPFWAENFGKIVNKNRELVPFIYKPGQRAFDDLLEGQRAAGKPMRAIVLKARKVGISTATQAKLIHRCTLREHYAATVVAQDKKTGQALYKIGERLYANLPDIALDDGGMRLKPKLVEYLRKRSLHFADDKDWTRGSSFPDSTYFVDTANEFESGRGETPTAIHASEVAFWAQIGTKLTALKNSVPRTPETLFVIESTANGYNEFKDIWDDAEKGRSNYEAFFWPWWKEGEYRIEFPNIGERERFIVGDEDNPYAEEEPDLVKNLGLSAEQLYWRRQTIADECNGDVRKFHQEYPSTSEEAFISTGKKVFDPYRVAQIAKRVEEESHPRVPTPEVPGPRIGSLKGDAHRLERTYSDAEIKVPTKTLWLPREAGGHDNALWRFWLDLDDQGNFVAPSEYIIGVDVSGGKTETTDEPDYHAIEVIDHKTREQVAEYRSRIEVDLLALEVLLAALIFNDAVVAIERTGSWGMPVLRTLWNDYGYPHLYRAKRVGNTSEPTEKRLGWDTNVRTKPNLIAGMAGLLREGTDGIRSRDLLDELRTYTRTEKGTTEAEPKKYDDRLMAYMIAQEVASEEPIMSEGTAGRGFVAQAPGVGSYDPRY